MHKIIKELQNEMILNPIQHEYPMIKPGTKVIVNAASGMHVKGGANGHTCRIKCAEVSSYRPSGYWKYELEWDEKDNPGKKFPIALNHYYYMEHEISVLAMPYPSEFKGVDSLPDI